MRNPGVYADIDIEDYHKEEGISSTGVKLILDCPQRYLRYYEELRLASDKKVDKSLEIGRAVHLLSLEPEKFDSSFYVLKESVNLTTTVGKKIYKDAQEEANGRYIIRKEDNVVEMAESVRKNALWNRLNHGKIEHSIYWNGGVYNTRLRARPDIFNDRLIIDIKTTDCISTFPQSIFRFGYHIQAAMQIDGLMAIDNKKRSFGFLVVEKKTPFFTACFTLDEESIEAGRKKYLEGARIYSECLADNKWTGYDEKFQLVTLPKWALERCENEQ